MQKRFARQAEILFDSFVLLVFTAVLIRPLFKAKYLAFWFSIESTFIADARFLMAHWPHPQWQPLWYTGTRFDYIYPPALRYGTAIFAMATGWLPVKAYHVYTAFLYSLGIAGVYVLIRIGSGSRGAAYLGAIATAVMSPSFLFITPMRLDAWSLAPQRLGALVKYGEGPHITAVALIPFFLAFAWRALERRRPASLALAALFCAAVVSTNFYGATAIAMFYPILVWSLWITRRDARILTTEIAIPVLAYSLTAFDHRSSRPWTAGASLADLRRRILDLFLIECPRSLLFRFSNFRRAITAGARARSRDHSWRAGSAGLALESRWEDPASRRRRIDARGICSQFQLPSSCVGDVPFVD